MFESKRTKWPFVRLLHENNQISLSNQSSYNTWYFSNIYYKIFLWWREETIEIEWERVELFIPAICFKCSKLSPPWHSSIFGTLLIVKSVVQEYSNYQCNSWWRIENGIQKVIELQNQSEKKKHIISLTNFCLVCLSWEKKLTHPALVWAGPWSALIVNSLKYSGMDKPKKRDTPTINRFRIEFMLVNCKNDRPTEAENQQNITIVTRP